MRVAWRAGMVAGLMICAMAGHGSAEMESMGKPGPSVVAQPDGRTKLDLPPSAQDGLKLTMREHLEGLEAIVAAMAKEDFEGAAAIAHEQLGFSKHHQAMQRQKEATFPSRYHELATIHHQEAEDLAAVLPTKDLKTILPKLERAIGACTACHRAYTL